METHIVYTGVMIVFALLLVGLNGFFVAAEFAFVKVRKTQLDLLAAAGNKRARSALFGVTHLDAYLSVCQLGITLASLGLGWIGEPAVARALRPVFSFFSITSPTLITTLSVAMGFTLITLLHVVFGELAPKSISIQKAEATALLLARFMRFFYVLCLPLVTVMNGISNSVLRLVGIGPAGEAELSHSPEELRMLILDSSQRGRLDKEEGRMLDNIFSFYQKSAKDIMIHRMDAIALDVETSRDKALELAHESGHTRFPIYEETRDNIIGFIHIKDLLHNTPRKNLRPILRAPLYAHETLHLDRLLRRMQNKRQQFCVVIDEYGIWQGILTMEDVIEAIVGDIQDEFDNETPDVVAQADGSYLVSGDMSLDDLTDYISFECADPSTDMYKILAAHFIDALDRIPEQGDEIELCGKRLIVVAMERNRMRSVRVENIDKDAANPAHGEETGQTEHP
ncbi:hemolysin family protein [Desulfosarcina sp. OttesenSCG-928-A07]|nr:hemolysin family protein [Desulfosarcina sp. OttesenSCG-928-G17]MDL2329105.1 hemolysin family protein [Desulfosarcina sp. OttesenSCG-928-A07]